jgi:S-(hydroxymethyl)glutathione dehydrogenase/alcohol dehydrogenase
MSCIGTLAERTIVNERSVIKIRTDVPFSVAAVVGCAVTTGLGAVFNRAQVRAGATAVVIGAGGVGLSVVQGCRIAGAARIVAIDPVVEKRALALEVGATEVVDPGADDPVALMGDGADYVFEAVGSGRLLRQAWDLAGPAGTVVGIGVAANDDTVVLPAQELALTEKTLMGSVYGTSRPQQDMLRYLDLYRSGELKLDELITREYPLAEINEAFRDLGESRISGRAVFSLR